MDSQGCAGGEGGIALQGHASPIDTPSICVREGGQIGERPSMRTFQRVGIKIIGTDETWVEG